MLKPEGLFCALILVCSGCGVSDPSPAPHPAPTTHEAVAPLAAPASPSVEDPSRLVVLGGGVTEIVFALGKGDAVAAVDASSKVPDAASQKATLGFYRRLAAEGILAQAPTAVLASEGTGPPAVLEQLQSAGVPVHHIDGAVTLDEAKVRMNRLGALLGERAAAEAMVAQLDRELREVDALTKGLDRPRVLFIYARGGGTLMVAGQATSAESMILAAGGVLASPGHEGFRPMTAESVVAAAPDIILLTDGGLEVMGGIDGVVASPGVSATPAGVHRRVVSMDDNLLLAMGPRTGASIRTLAHHLHPELAR